MADFSWKRHDTAPAVQVQLTVDSGPVDLTGATVKFIMAIGQGAATVNAAATIVNAVLGIVSYTPVAADTALAGDYQVEWQVTFLTGGKQTFPNPGYQTLHIDADLDNL